MSTAVKWGLVLVVGQGVTIAVGWLLLKRFLKKVEVLITMLSLIHEHTNDAVIELQRHRGILRFKPPEPPDEPPLFVG